MKYKAKPLRTDLRLAPIIEIIKGLIEYLRPFQFALNCQENEKTGEFIYEKTVQNTGRIRTTSCAIKFFVNKNITTKKGNVIVLPVITKL